MSRARSWVSQVKPAPIVLMVTSSGKRSRQPRSPVSQRPLTNCTTPTLQAVAEAAHDHAEGGGRFALALAGVDDEQALLDRLGRAMILARAAGSLACLLGMAGVDLGFAQSSFFMARLMPRDRRGCQRPSSRMTS